MLKKTITYTDYDGNQQTEDFLFQSHEGRDHEAVHVSGGWTGHYAEENGS